MWSAKNSSCFYSVLKLDINYLKIKRIKMKTDGHPVVHQIELKTYLALYQTLSHIDIYHLDKI